MSDITCLHSSASHLAGHTTSLRLPLCSRVDSRNQTPCVTSIHIVLFFLPISLDPVQPPTLQRRCWTILLWYVCLCCHYRWDRWSWFAARVIVALRGIGWQWGVEGYNACCDRDGTRTRQKWDGNECYSKMPRWVDNACNYWRALIQHWENEMHLLRTV